MINDTAALCITVAPPPAAPTPATPQAAGAPDRDEFARCLDAAAAPKQPAAEEAAPAVDKKRPGTPAATRAVRRDAVARAPEAVALAAQALAAEACGPDAAKTAAEVDAGRTEAAERQPADAGADAVPASPLPWAPALAQPAIAARGSDAGAGNDVAAAVLAAVAEGRPRAAAAHDAIAARPERAAPAGSADAPAAAPEAARIAAPEAAPLAVADTATAAPRSRETTAAAVPGTPALVAAPQAFAAAAARTLDATPLPVGHVAAPVDSAGFAPALATQVRWLVREGLQTAQLSLNPPEMGPLSVQIVVDGRQTRIDFTADMAATRQAIEQSLPVLAAALDDSGLTLSGGGVHDGRQGQPQPQQQPGALRDAAWHAGRPDSLEVPGGAATASSPRPPHPARGLVDLVA